MAQMLQLWEFANDGVWTRYGDDVQTKIQQAMEANLAWFEVSACHILDFAQYRQFHKDDHSKWRGVRVVPVVNQDGKPAPLDGSSRLSPAAPAMPDACDCGIAERVTQTCGMAWRWCAGQETDEAEEWWEFKLDGQGWQRYPAEVNTRINEARRAGHSQVEVPPNHVINFAQGRQSNKSDVSRWRAVRSQTVAR